eukprot:4385717-Prymnesium_polylepis.1
MLPSTLHTSWQRYASPACARSRGNYDSRAVLRPCSPPPRPRPPTSYIWQARGNTTCRPACARCTRPDDPTPPPIFG